MKAMMTSALALVVLTTSASAMAQEVLRDLESKDPHTLSVDEVKSFMPGARVSRLGQTGNTVFWTNESDGSLIATSDNRSYGSVRSSQSHGKWNITDDGRYCVFIDYQRVQPEQWCRFIIKTSDGFYGASSTSNGAQKVYKLDITK
jgi:hypothetical protein